MAINISLAAKPNPHDLTEAWKYYATAQTSSTMDINAFAEHISSHGCNYSRADIAAVLTMAVDCMRENLLLGNMIKLGDLGSFEVALKCSGAETAAKFRTDVNIVDMYVNWTPGTRFTNLLQSAEFNLVPSRKSMRKIMQAIKAGELTIDLSDDKDDSSDDSSSSGDSGSSTDSSGSSSDSGSGSSSSSDNGDGGNSGVSSGDDGDIV